MLWSGCSVEDVPTGLGAGRPAEEHTARSLTHQESVSPDVVVLQLHFLFEVLRLLHQFIDLLIGEFFWRRQLLAMIDLVLCRGFFDNLLDIFLLLLFLLFFDDFNSVRFAIDRAGA